MKALVFIFFLIFIAPQIKNHQGCKWYKYNSCKFKLQKNITSLENLTIIKYSIINNPNKKKELLCSYYLIRNSVDTFNVIDVFNQPSSDSMFKEHFQVDKWNFEKSRDTCINFKSQVDLGKLVNKKFPILIGKVFIYFD